jgi:hypothetical protein
MEKAQSNAGRSCNSIVDEMLTMMHGAFGHRT